MSGDIPLLPHMALYVHKNSFVVYFVIIIVIININVQYLLFITR